MSDWRDERNEYIEGSLLDEDDRRDWEAQRDVDLGHEPQHVSTDEMVDTWARDKREVENRSELERIAEKAAWHEWFKARHGLPGGTPDEWEAAIWEDEHGDE